MRQWNVNPKLMCRNHLLGEHFELHKLAGAINKGKNIEWAIVDGYVETGTIGKRHNQLVKEMIRRGYNHNSPLKQPRVKGEGKIDIKANIKELTKRCRICKKRKLEDEKGKKGGEKKNGNRKV